VSSRQILVIEDEFLIGLEIHSLLAEAGFGVVGPATTVPAALKHISEGNFDAALVDANLGGHSIDGVTAALADRGTPFILVTRQKKLTTATSECAPYTKAVRPSHRYRCRSKAFSAALSAGILWLDFRNGSWSCKNDLEGRCRSGSWILGTQATIAAISSLMPRIFMTRVRL
jgi:CheY-like chemotaxis protein